MSLWGNRFWDAVELWKKGVGLCVRVTFLLVSGGLLTALFFGLLVVLPIEIINGSSDVEDYLPGVMIAGCIIYGPYMIGNCKDIFISYLRDE